MRSFEESEKQNKAKHSSRGYRMNEYIAPVLMLDKENQDSSNSSGGYSQLMNSDELNSEMFPQTKTYILGSRP